ncbi:Alpha-1,3-mannosyltransferase-like protein [Entomortierella chlamydospora]|uniref:Alpha-1,3/1,6-mannosyltransferase ALG2 n=1 Tax=Entomortierella chlamydospora TaxID=101097 RepID=A0A9P6MM40_9FUNG|nr:Alpha-1,3-mannosyltransferase-like protein [Entomortierella chlamydospora]KAG0007522.1 Alpha-1,3-mannosyltransferase-like protein [Entomortierella chlamydospora]
MASISEATSSTTTDHSASEPFTPLRVAFIHPDLGIGGAERLVVDAAVGLQNRGHNVVMYTSHHDPKHCFEETRDGTLTVHVGGNTIVPRTILGRFYIICAIFRNLHLAWNMLLLNYDAPSKEKFDIIIVDQLSVSIPLLRLTGAKIFFYCHFPDKLLTKRESLLKKIYRVPVDFIEELTTGMADTIVVNSKFTANIFKESFKTLRQVPEVLYPSIQFDKFDRVVEASSPEIKILTPSTNKITFLSVNRYERKKDINLAIHAFARLLKSDNIGISTQQSIRLVIAGGYDTRVVENVEHHLELVQLAEKYGLKTWTLSAGQTDKAVPEDTQVLFLQSISDAQKLFLLQTSRALLYTPTNEHFGIVPVEAMYMKCPVVAVNSGGPTESILNEVTGYLCPAEEDIWANTLRTLLEKSEEELKAMGQAGHDRVVGLFSLTAFVTKLNGILMELYKKPSTLESYGLSGSMRPLLIFTVLTVVLAVMLYR